MYNNVFIYLQMNSSVDYVQKLYSSALYIHFLRVDVCDVIIIVFIINMTTTTTIIIQ